MNYEVKQKYLPLVTKREICETIKSNSIMELEGMLIYDSINHSIAQTLSLLQFYCDIQLDDIDIDKLYKDGTVDCIVGQIPASEINFIEHHTKQMIDSEINTFNSVSGVLNRNIKILIDKIPDEKGIKSIFAEASKQINKVKPENIKILKNIFTGQKNEVEG